MGIFQTKKDQRGVAHHFILPVLAIVAVGSIGTFLMQKSRAAVPSNGSVVYRAFQDSGSPYYLKGLSATTSTAYPSDIYRVDDISIDQKWLLSVEWVDGKEQFYARSIDGKIKIPYNISFTSYSATCTAAITQPSAKFSKITSDPNPPKIFYANTVYPCVGGKTGSPTSQLRSVSINGANNKALGSSYAGQGSVVSTAKNDYVLTWFKDRYRIYNGATATITYNAPRHDISTGTVTRDLKLAESGTKIVIKEYVYGTGYKIYIRTSSGSFVKSLSTKNLAITSVSPTASYVTYQSPLTADYKKAGLYVMNTSTLSTKLVDSVYGRQAAIPDGITGETWSHGGGTILYGRIDVIQKTAQIRRVNPDGTGLSTVVSTPFETTKWYQILW